MIAGRTSLAPQLLMTFVYFIFHNRFFLTNH